MVLFKTENDMLYSPAVALLGTYPKEMNIYFHTDTCTWVFTVVLFVTAQTGNYPNALHQINSLTVIHPYYGILKRNRLLIHATTWINLEGNYTEWKKTSLKRIHPLHHFTYITLIKEHNYRNRKLIAGCQVLGMERERMGMAVKEWHKGGLWWWLHCYMR